MDPNHSWNINEKLDPYKGERCKGFSKDFLEISKPKILTAFWNFARAKEFYLKFFCQFLHFALKLFRRRRRYERSDPPERFWGGDVVSQKTNLDDAVAAVWQDVGIKSGPICSKRCPKSRRSSFSLKSLFSHRAQKITKYLGYRFKKMFWPDLSKMAQSGHTAAADIIWLIKFAMNFLVDRFVDNLKAKVPERQFDIPTPLLPP